jgi:hypothetical protein
MNGELKTDVTHYVSKMFKKSLKKIGFLSGETMFKKSDFQKKSDF